MNMLKTNNYSFLNIKTLSVGGAMLLGACASSPPKELVDARAAYDKANGGRAAQLAPAELHKAKSALDKAERAYEDDAESPETKTFAYVAERKALLAEAIGDTRHAERQETNAVARLDKERGEQVNRVRSDLQQTRQELEQTKREREEYERKAQEAADKLAKLAAVKEEERGMVITLSGSVLFASNKATLLPAAQTRLNEVTEALMATQDRNVVVEGHTDSRGSDSHNLALSQERAEAVRSYLVSRGYPTDKIQARGIGEARPIADDKSAEGRANNRRVEIVIEPARAAGSNMGQSGAEPMGAAPASTSQPGSSKPVKK